MNLKPRKPEYRRWISPSQLHEGNLACCSNPHQTQRLSVDCQREDASATDLQRHDTQNKPWVKSSKGLMEQTFQSNPNEYKTYLVDYRYKGQTWCIELTATSWEDAQARVKCLVNANVAGEVALKIPVPETLIERLRQWIKWL